MEMSHVSQLAYDTHVLGMCVSCCAMAYFLVFFVKEKDYISPYHIFV